MIETRRTLVSVLISLALVVTAVGSLWLMASAGVFSGGESPVPGAVGGATPSGGASPFQPGSNFQVEQPRDPFRPLITVPEIDDTSTTLPGDTTTTVPGDTTTTTGTGGTTTTSTTVAGSTTTTTQGDSPDQVRVVLLEVRDESGVLVAVVEVDGVQYTVRVGDTFATDFKVVSLTENGGVFTFGDTAFTLAVGQSILK